jgi:hypothetical protein
MLMWHKELWLIDHGAALYFHHSWDNWREQAQKPFVQIKDHVLLSRADSLDMVDAAFKTLLSDDHIRTITALIPDEWLTNERQFETPADHREAYTQFLISRIAVSANFVKEAQHARQTLI